MWTKENVNNDQGDRIRGHISSNRGRDSSRPFQWPVGFEETAVLGLATGTAFIGGINRWVSERRGRVTLAALGLGVLLIPAVALECVGRVTYTPMTASEHAQLRASNAQLDSDYARRYNEIMSGLGVNSNAQSTPTITRFPLTGGQSP